MIPTAPTIPSTWILLDSQSTHCIFKSKNLLTNIRPCGHDGLTIHSNGGTQRSNLIGDYEPLGITVWYLPESLANILAMSNVKDKFRVTYDTHEGQRFVVHSAPPQYFKRVGIRLYILDTEEHNLGNKVKHSPNAYNFLSTVSNNESHFSARQIQQANKALSLYRALGRPSEQKFYDILTGNQLNNCETTVEDAKRAFFIHGPDVASIRGRMVRQRPDPIPAYHPLTLPPELLELHKEVNLSVDVFFVQGRPHLHTISRDIQFRTAEYLASGQYKSSLGTNVQKVIDLYHHQPGRQSTC
mmetsp:Transcript_25361/g.69903  ORF Transcript_25361/g.69903 Transcript_25361/m.69903 type:complete len:299 (+) Transcript_25361:426-1322(+)